jgi:hypothetical protein
MRTSALVIIGALAASVLFVPAPAQAAARVSVSNDQGSAAVDPTYATTLSVSGAGFQSIKGGHGGIYVFFGTVKGAWQPSKGGQVGTSYSYVPDSESRNNQGYQRFVAFPGSDTAAAANGGTVKADGTWSTRMTIPGASFKTVDRAGKAVTVDCTKVRCGIITIGAHGVKNAKNETFTPVRFESLNDGAAPSNEPTSEPAATAPAAGADTPAPAPAAAPPAASAPVSAADAAVVVDPGTAVLGRVLSFTGSGFAPGEQVVATLDDGRAAVGPLGAGPSGEIAGVIQLPVGTTAGTHVLRLTGAASGATPSVNFPIAADTAAAVADEDDGLAGWVPFAFLALAIVALLSAATFAALRIRAIRRGRTPVETATEPQTAPVGGTIHAL